ncbi:MAG: outer membrane protein assembly factor BamA [Arcobacter sp.]|uniref:Outer membrane protein assembly factor BamA n=1 Tax=Poseidonibacter ostreae TaxID=2654171 RepID=A0A6L4WVB4_9BACT|nr:outer membrane protein assembly factor BamA [Poseidonibacter ostreae]KAB7890438.1 outer membrane protein assembly factor BamA [Poseidonibacter ostreae]KAB7892277.1 outer membrane protein assembly factor BamA [Poseidonibacter ostreae]MAC84993.1 outer membrane protein assembly factor BamA [Arcobacter sp.]
MKLRKVVKNKVILFSLACATALCADTIQSIEYNNLNKISQKIVNETLDMKPGDEFNDYKINNAIKEFYKFGYFDDIVVINDNGKLQLNFKEKPSIANIDIQGYKSRTDDIESLKTMIKLKKGSMYTEKRVKDAKKVLLDLLENDGYINSVVETEIETINEHSLKLTFNVNKGDEIIIKKANYYGASELDQDDFDNVTANKEKEVASWWFGQNDGEVKIDQLKYDARRINELYFEKGYLDAQVKEPFLNIDFASNQANLDFFIKEGTKYITNDIKIYVDSSIVDAKDIYPELDLIVGNTFNIKKLRLDQAYIKTQVANKGYAYAQVKFDVKKDTKNSKVDIVHNVIPGKKVYINDVKISGNSRTLDRVIRRDVYLAPGDLYNETDFTDTKSKLSRSSYFEKVKVEQKRVSEDKIDILIEVVEAATGALTLGGGYGSYDKLMVSGSVKDSNIFGSGLGVGISADLSANKTEFSVNLSNPAINDSKFNGDIEAHNSDAEISKSVYDLDKNTKGFSIGVGREILRNLRGGLRYKLDFIQEEYTYDDDSTVPDASRFQDAEYISSSLTPYLSFDNTDNYQLPREGIKAGTSLEYAGVGGDSKYLKSSTYLKYFNSLNDYAELDWIFRFRTRISALIDNGQINQGDSLYLGGVKSLRGYSSYAFPTNTTGYVTDPYKRSWANSVEMSFPLIPNAKMRWALFYDYGMIGEDNFSDVARSSTGAVLEWISPLGPLQLIFAKALDAEADDETSSFEFSLGSSF